ncbi:MAG TPA: PilZ domain-containing protein [Terriglobales bacterium]
MRIPLLLKRERRRWKRHWFSTSVHIVSGAHRIDGFAIQVSRGGMYMFAIADLAVGSEIKVAFTQPGSGERIELCGAVRHRAVYLYGVEFLPEEHDGAPDETLGAMLNQGSASLP